MTFWDHIDQLRSALVQPVIAIALLSVTAFVMKEQVFNVVFAANSPDFAVYSLADTFGQGSSVEPHRATYVRLISTELPAQFLVHMKVSFYVGLLLAIPFVFYRLFRFASPGLYRRERRYSALVLMFSTIAFYSGIVVNYFVIFPFSLRFLADYQVSAEVENTITISSYIGTLMTLSILMGIFFELPVMAWLLSKLGLIKSSLLKKYRRHAIVAILIIAAVITPTTDIFTLLLVSVPIMFLYELSILITALAERKRKVPTAPKTQ